MAIQGKARNKKIKSNTGRRRINIIGGINAVSLKPTVIITEDNCKKEIVAQYIGKLAKQYPQAKRIFMVLDNAKYNRAKAVKEKAKECNVVLVYLPPIRPT